MGHEVVVYRDRHAIFSDEEFGNLRRVLSIEASTAGFAGVASFISGWTYHRPGVWADEDFDAFFHGDVALEREFVAVLGAARDRVEAFGDGVPVVSLTTSVGDPFREAPPTAGLIRAIDRLRDLFPVLAGEAASENAVEVIWASDRKRRAEIVRRDDGLFQIVLWREVPGDGEWEPDAYWSAADRDAILTDTLERAKALADVELRLLGD
jgi:hypothetical protein